jgi:hypothetical protein
LTSGKPDNVHIERFVAQSEVLPLVDLIVHHGGTGTVLGALQAGLPQLLLPQGADQFINAEILITAGAVRALTNEAQQPGAIGEAVQALLGDCPERKWPLGCAMRSLLCLHLTRWCLRCSISRAVRCRGSFASTRVERAVPERARGVVIEHERQDGRPPSDSGQAVRVCCGSSIRNPTLSVT